jgi:hypothetical protein
MKSGNLHDKLVRVERTINVYDNNNDDELLKEINIDFIPFDELKSIVIPIEDDPLLYLGYRLNNDQIMRLNSYLLEKITPDFSQFTYILVPGGIYDWDKKNE